MVIDTIIIVCFDIFQALICVYLVAVVLLVRRQIHQVGEEEVERIIITDKKGKTEIKKVEKVLRDENNILV